MGHSRPKNLSLPLMELSHLQTIQFGLALATPNVLEHFEQTFLRPKLRLVFVSAPIHQRQL